MALKVAASVESSAGRPATCRRSSRVAEPIWLVVAVISASLMVLLYFQAALYTPPFYKQRQYRDSIGGILRHIVEQNAPHRTVLALSPGIYPFWPMLTNQ